MRPFLLLLTSILLFSSCKKDQLHVQKVTQMETGTHNRLNRIQFINDSLCIVVGGSRFLESDILVSRDGAHSWALSHSLEAPKELFGICQRPGGGIYLIGFDGHMLRSEDEAHNWTHFQLRFEAYKTLAFSDSEHALCIGGVSFERGDAMWIDPNGNVLSHDTTDFELNDLVLLPEGDGLRCGYGVMQYTNDGGKTWNWTELRKDNYKALDVHNSLLAYVCGGEGSVCVTRNGGKDWETLRNGNNLTLPKYRLWDLLFIDEQHGYAVGEKGAVIYTDDAGEHWSEMEPFTSEHLYGIAKCPDGALLICGGNGGLWRVEP